MHHQACRKRWECLRSLLSLVVVVELSSVCVCVCVISVGFARRRIQSREEAQDKCQSLTRAIRRREKKAFSAPVEKGEKSGTLMA